MRFLIALCLPLLLVHGAPHHQQLHKLMTDQEKQFYFGDDEPEGYEVIEVLRPKSKHNSEAKTRDVHFHAMGEQFKLKMKPNKKLLAPQVINM